MQKQYTVTGATGYIGYKTTEHLLKNGHFVYAIVRENSDISRLLDLQEKYRNIELHSYSGEECDLEFAIENSGYVIHLGAYYTTSNDEKATVDLINSNILFSTQIFNVAERVNPETIIVSASTFSSLDGEGAYSPSTLYAATKKAVEIIAEFYKTLSIRFLTLPDTFGPGDWRPKIHNILARNEKWPFEFRSPASQEMRLLHVEDIIGHILYVLEHRVEEKEVKIYDIHTKGILLTLEELSKKITDKKCLFNENPEVEPVELPEKPRDGTSVSRYKNIHTEFSLSE